MNDGTIIKNISMSSFLYNDSLIKTNHFLLPNLKLLGGQNIVRPQQKLFHRYFGTEISNPIYKLNFSPEKKIDKKFITSKEHNKGEKNLLFTKRRILIKSKNYFQSVKKQNKRKSNKNCFSPVCFSTIYQENKENNYRRSFTLENSFRNTSSIQKLNKACGIKKIKKKPHFLFQNYKLSNIGMTEQQINGNNFNNEGIFGNTDLNIMTLDFPYRETKLNKKSFMEMLLFKRNNKDKYKKKKCISFKSINMTLTNERRNSNHLKNNKNKLSFLKNLFCSEAVNGN